MVNDGADDLTTVDATDIGGEAIEYKYGKMIDLSTLPNNCNWPPAFADQTASVDVTRQSAYDNQVGPGDVILNNAAVLRVSSGTFWALRDQNNAGLFTVTEGSGGGTSQVSIDADVDIYNNDAVDVDFANTVKVATASGTSIQLGGAGGVIQTLANDMRLLGFAELILDDGNQTGSTWSQTGIKLSDTTAEWDTFETNFGETSLLDANRSDKLCGQIWFVRVSLILVSCEPHFVASDQTEGCEMQHQVSKESLLVNPREVARMLSVSSRKLWAMTFEEQPGLPYIRCGRLVRYSIDDLRCWIESQRKGGDDVK